MTYFIRIYEWATTALAVVAGLIMAAIFVFVVFDVTMRNLGYQPLAGVQPLAEYGLLYITMLGSPWLLRTNGLIVVESLRLMMPVLLKRIVEKIVYIVCLAVCIILFWYSTSLGISSWERSLFDQRAISIPLSLAYAPMIIGFFLMGIEFTRLLAGRGTIYGQSATEREGL